MRRKLTLVYHTAMFAALMGMATVVYYQQISIDNLVDDAAISIERDNVGLDYVSSLHRLLNKHLEEGCISTPKEDKLLLQMDLLIASSRSGWRAAERLARTYEYQEIMRQ